jgi:hypothetical protein
LRAVAISFPEDISVAGNVQANGVVGAKSFLFGGPGVALGVSGEGPVAFRVIDIDPTTGLAANIGTLALRNTPGNVGVWQKTGTSDGAWTLLEASGAPTDLVGPTLQLTPAITPAALTTSQNNYAPTGGGGASVWRISATTPVNITGLAVGQADGDVYVITNVGSSTITLVHESASSTAANRLSCPGADSIVLATLSTAMFIYDGTAARFRCIAVALTPASTPSGLLVKRTYLTTGTSFTTQATTNSIFLRMVGGGGGGGGYGPSTSTSAGAGGGSAGSYCEKTFAVTPSTAYVYAIGAFGVGGVTGTSNSGAVGGNGSASTLTVGSTTVSAGGGNGGMAAVGSGLASDGGDKGSAANGDLNMPGAAGFAGIGTSLAAFGGNGGSCPLGGGGRGAIAGVTGASAGGGFGSGGGGGAVINGGVASSGAAGLSGEIIVEEYT